MLDERVLVAACITDRKAFDALAGKLDPADFGAQAGLVIKAATDFYGRDAEAQAVDLEVLRSYISRTFANQKHAQSVLAWLDELPEAVSGVNVAAEYRQLKRHRVGLELAAKLAGGDHSGDTDRLLAQYVELGGAVEAGEKPKLSFEDLRATVGSGSRVKLVPGELNRQCAGGALRGHNIVVYGRPESGKTMFAINLTGGFLKQGLTVLYAGNEEPVADLQRRILSRLSGIPVSRIVGTDAALAEAIEKARLVGYDRLVAQELKSGRVAELEGMVRRYKPDVLVLDQLKNLQAPGEGNRALELDTAARAVRRLGKQYGMVTVSVTQAGESAEGKLKLDMSDVEWSKTGIPGAADLMVGIGVNDQYHAANRRMINLPKNKLSGRHAYFALFVEPEFNLFRSQPRTGVSN